MKKTDESLSAGPVRENPYAHLSSQDMELLYYGAEPYALELMRSIMALTDRQRRQALTMLRAMADLNKAN